VRASIAVPGLFTAGGAGWTAAGGRGLVNPVPVSLCRAMGADIVIAVDLNADMVGRSFRKPAEAKDIEPPGAPVGWRLFSNRLQASPRAHQERPEILEIHALGTGRFDKQHQHHADAHRPQPARR